MNTYLNLLEKIRNDGSLKMDRTGTGTMSLFGQKCDYPLYRFPIITTKKVNFKAVATELIWFISGSTNTKYLTDRGVNIWNEWADKEGNLGPVYGKQWTDWNGINQLKNVIERIKTNPDCRRLIVSAWNVTDIPDMALAPCHVMYQFYVANGELSCALYQRSADMFLGVPYNISSYALLTCMIARECGLVPGKLTHFLGDCHIYLNHLEQVDRQLSREAMPLPMLRFRDTAPLSVFELTPEDVYLEGYESHKAIKAPVAV